MIKNVQRSINHIDTNVLSFLTQKTQNNFFDKIMPFITHSNDFGQVYMIFALYILFKDKNVNAFICIMSALLIGLLFGEGVIKRLVRRSRPLQNNCRMLINFPKSYSFPSGHTTSSFAVLGVVWTAFPTYKYIILALAVLIAFSRLYLNVHYPSDVLGGIVLGIICASVTLWIFHDGSSVKNACRYSYDAINNVYIAAYSLLSHRI